MNRVIAIANQTRQQVMEMEEILVKPNSRNQKYIKT